MTDQDSKSSEIESKNDSEDVIKVSEDDFKHLKEDVSYGLEVIVEFHAPDKETMNAINETLNEYDWIMPYGYGATEKIEENTLTIKYTEGDENAEERMQIFAKYIPTTRIELTMIRKEWYTFNDKK